MTPAPPHPARAAWRAELREALAAPGAPRTFNPGQWRDFAQQFMKPRGQEASPRTIAEIGHELAELGAFKRVGSRLYLNIRATPPAIPAELARYLRAGAIPSLHTPLGECGFLNNPSTMTMSVVPTSTSLRPRLGLQITTTGERFRFFGLAERFFPQSSEDRDLLLQPGRGFDIFRPEAALLHWIHLGNNERSDLPPPPIDVDLEALDLKRLFAIAKKWAMVEPLDVWIDRARARNFGEQADENDTLSKALAAARRSLTAESDAGARTRLLSRLRRPS